MINELCIECSINYSQMNLLQQSNLAIDLNLGCNFKAASVQMNKYMFNYQLYCSFIDAASCYY